MYVGRGSSWWFQLFSPLAGEMIQFDEHIFQLGWFNHQLGAPKRLTFYSLFCQKKLLGKRLAFPKGGLRILNWRSGYIPIAPWFPVMMGDLRLGSQKTAVHFYGVSNLGMYSGKLEICYYYIYIYDIYIYDIHTEKPYIKTDTWLESVSIVSRPLIPTVD